MSKNTSNRPAQLPVNKHLKDKTLEEVCNKIQDKIANTMKSEFNGILMIGPTGCGKSTTVNFLLGE